MNIVLSAHEIRCISADGCVHPSTVVRAYSGLRVRSTTWARIFGAARKLGLPLPSGESGRGDDQGGDEG